MRLEVFMTVAILVVALQVMTVVGLIVDRQTVGTHPHTHKCDNTDINV
jgi:hypothetical protein